MSLPVACQGASQRHAQSCQVPLMRRSPFMRQMATVKSQQHKLRLRQNSSPQIARGVVFMPYAHALSLSTCWYEQQRRCDHMQANRVVAELCTLVMTDSCGSTFKADIFKGPVPDLCLELMYLKCFSTSRPRMCNGVTCEAFAATASCLLQSGQTSRGTVSKTSAMCMRAQQLPPLVAAYNCRL